KGGAGDLGGALEENCGPHLTAVLLNQRIVRCIVYRRSTLAAHSFPSLRRFLTLAPACWSRGKIPPHPSARSARHSSPQNGGPKGKMIEGRSGGSGRGTRRELWAPPDSGSAQPTDRTLYRLPTLDPSLSPRRPRISFPPPLPHPSHLPAGHGEKFCRTQAHVRLGTRLRRMARPKGKMIGSAQAPRRPLYCVPTPTPAARPGRHAFPSVGRRFVIVCTCIQGDD